MSIFDYIHQGGVIMYILLLLNVIGFAIMGLKGYKIMSETKRTLEVTDRIAAGLKPQLAGKDVQTVVEITKRELGIHVGGLEKGLNTIKIIASISPLLGLLGTVIGVLIAFKVISQSGLTDPGSFADGISMALITTVGGLIVAIPHFIGHNYLLGMLDNLEVRLEKEVLSRLL